MNIRVEPLDKSQVSAAVALMARAFATSPLHVAAFGAGAVRRNETFFRIGLRLMKGPKLAAFDGSRIVGVIHWVDAPQCQISASERSLILPEMLLRFGLSRTRKLITWLGTWGKYDPAQQHNHLGPIAVEHNLQGQGIGSLLME